MTSDDYPAYETALLDAYGQEVTTTPTGRPSRRMVPEKVPPPGLNYATVEKRREKGRVVEIVTRVVFGTMAAVLAALAKSKASRRINTSFLERQNATDRHHNARKVRKTYTFRRTGRWRYNVLGAFDAVTHRLIRVTNDGYINAESVCTLLRSVAEAAVGLPITLVLDNARYQKCAVVQALAASLGIELLYLPSYSPNLNLIERLWRFVREGVAELDLLREVRGVHGRHRRVPGRLEHRTQGRDGNADDPQVSDV